MYSEMPNLPQVAQSVSCEIKWNLGLVGSRSVVSHPADVSRMDFSFEVVLFLSRLKLAPDPFFSPSLLCFCSAGQPHQLHCVCCYSNNAAVLLGIITVLLCRELQLELQRALPGSGGFLVFEAS